MKEFYKQLVNSYIRAKDHHRPHLMKNAFTEDATLDMVVNTDAITFPSKTVGLAGITKTLVSDFHEKFDNVYTFCINDSGVVIENSLRCTWLVGMTDVDSGLPRVGYGEYHWTFNNQVSQDKLRARQLVITINNMIVLHEDTGFSVLPWLDTLHHPWVTLSDLSNSAPDVAIIKEFLRTGWQVKN